MNITLCSYFFVSFEIFRNRMGLINQRCLNVDDSISNLCEDFGSPVHLLFFYSLNLTSLHRLFSDVGQTEMLIITVV